MLRPNGIFIELTWWYSKQHFPVCEKFKVLPSFFLVTKMFRLAIDFRISLRYIKQNQRNDKAPNKNHI